MFKAWREREKFILPFAIRLPSVRCQMNLLTMFASFRQAHVPCRRPRSLCSVSLSPVPGRPAPLPRGGGGGLGLGGLQLQASAVTVSASIRLRSQLRLSTAARLIPSGPLNTKHAVVDETPKIETTCIFPEHCKLGAMSRVSAPRHTRSRYLFLSALPSGSGLPRLSQRPGADLTWHCRHVGGHRLGVIGRAGKGTISSGNKLGLSCPPSVMSSSASTPPLLLTLEPPRRASIPSPPRCHQKSTPQTRPSTTRRAVGNFPSGTTTTTPRG